MMTIPPRPARAVGLGALVGLLACAFELAGRSMARASALAAVGGVTVAPAAVVGAATALLVAGAWSTWRDPARRVHALMVWLLFFALPAGLAAQLALGARLQSDGFYYFAHLRSLWFDHDQDLTNDYRLLGMASKTNLFVPTPTGYAQSAWTIGPSIVWGPFFAAGDLVAHRLQRTQPDLKTDGTSYPYRQAVCVAGLVWGLLGLYCGYRLTALYVPEAWAALATVLVGLGSFVLWYLVKEPSMTHAPSMAAVAAFTWAWAATRERRRPWHWVALGLLAGFMGTIRWQNVLFAVLPAIEWLESAVSLWRGAGARALGVHVAHGLAFTAAAVVGFTPQMLAWKAIYGQYLAVSPVGPQIRWWAPHVGDILWSSRNGLFATSPILYVGAIGLLLMLRPAPRFAVPALVAFALMTYFNASIQDWWGSAGYGMRRFDGVVPLLTVGTAVALRGLAAAISRRPQAVAVVAGAALVLWNLTFMQAALTGAVDIGTAVSFERLAGLQAATLERWFGHPFSLPANAVFAVRNGLPLTDYDVLWTSRFLSDPAQPYGRIDIGGNDEPYLGQGWYGVEQGAAAVTYRWTAERAELLVPLDHAADLRVIVRAMPLAIRDARPARMRVETAGVPRGEVELPEGWQTVELLVPAAGWRSGVNRLVLVFGRMARPADLGGSGDRRVLAAAFDWIAFRVPETSARSSR